MLHQSGDEGGRAVYDGHDLVVGHPGRPDNSHHSVEMADLVAGGHHGQVEELGSFMLGSDGNLRSALQRPLTEHGSEQLSPFRELDELPQAFLGGELRLG